MAAILADCGLPMVDPAGAMIDQANSSDFVAGCSLVAMDRAVFDPIGAKCHLSHGEEYAALPLAPSCPANAPRVLPGGVAMIAGSMLTAVLGPRALDCVLPAIAAPL